MQLISDFAERLKKWYLENGRELPWRTTSDPYAIWISEVILQQTRVDQGLAYYHRFLGLFPDVTALAGAPTDLVLKTWQGLGYYSRARNLHATAKLILEQHQGRFPTTFNDLIGLKGIGPYTAAAISSFAFNEVQPVVDGNVYRFLSRLFGIDTPIDSTAGKKEFYELVQTLIDRHHPGTHNQAMMEMGALVCTPVNPRCEECPFVIECSARRENRTTTLPVKSKKQVVRDRFFNYLVLHDGKKVIIRQRGEGDIWQGLFEFPLLEGDQLEEKDFLKAALQRSKEAEIEYISEEVVHLLSHQRLHARFFWVIVKDLKPMKGERLIRWEELHEYAIPRLMDRYLESEDGRLWAGRFE